MDGISWIKDGKCLLNIYCKKGCSRIIKTAAKDIDEVVKKITGVSVPTVELNDLETASKGIIVARFDQSENFKKDFIDDYKFLEGSDGYAVRNKDGKIYVLAHCDAGVFYGLHDLMEKNADVVWCRGAKEYAVEVLQSDEIVIKKCDYADRPDFAVRVWNTCGEGSDGVDHGDEGTAQYMGRNKINGIFHHVLDGWYDYAVTGQSIASAEFRNIDDLMDEHPEYFMTDENGQPIKSEELESFVNYYHPDVPKIYAKRMADFLDRNNPMDILGWNMPDDPTFRMIHGGVALHEQPFTADDGTTVYPKDANYKSTVYFNFINRLIKALNEIKPGTVIHTQAYMYSLPAPAITVDDGVVVKFAPLGANEKITMNDPERSDNYSTRDMLLEWIKKSNRVCINAYWNSFKGDMYSRPILSVAKQNILWWREIGVYGFTPEGKTDCSKLPKYSKKQKYGRNFYDMNEFFTWALNKLMWNPDEDIEELKVRYCKIVYKECAEEMLEYFAAVEDGWNSQDALVWYPTGPDVYVYAFMIKARVDGRIVAALKSAVQKAVTPNVKEKVAYIYKTVTSLIDVYRNFVKEDAEFYWCGGVDPLSEEQLDFVKNSDSVWNKATPQTVLKNYLTLEPCDQKANFKRMMLYDEKNIYFGFSVYYDDMVSYKEFGGRKVIYDDKGQEIFSRSESYIGGNSFNRSVYYGYVSGFNKNRPDVFYVNNGNAVAIAPPAGVRTVQRVYLSDVPEERRIFHVQVIPIAALGVTFEDFKPYGHFVYLSNKYGKLGWMGFGLWNKQNFSDYTLHQAEDAKERRRND